MSNYILPSDHINSGESQRELTKINYLKNDLNVIGNLTSML